MTIYKKYNGIEKEDDLEINIYDAQFRELDAQTGRWWQIDPVTDGYENLSPYASMYDNPISISDPLGDEGEACCWEEIKAVGNFVAGAAVGAVAGGIDNVTGSNLRGKLSSSFAGTGAAGHGWNFGLNVADAGGMVLGAAETITGGAGMFGATVATVGTGGAASPVTVPIGIGSTALATHGVFTMGNSANNMMNQNGRVNAGSNSSSGSNAGKRRENRIPDQGPPNSTQANKPGTTIKKYGPNGNVQKEFNKGHTGKGTPKKERKDHIHDYKPNRQNPSGRGTRMPGRKPKKNELKKDFGI